MLTALLTLALTFVVLAFKVYRWKRKFNQQVTQLQQELLRTQRVSQLPSFSPIL